MELPFVRASAGGRGAEEGFVDFDAVLVIFGEVRMGAGGRCVFRTSRGARILGLGLGRGSEGYVRTEIWA